MFRNEIRDLIHSALMIGPLVQIEERIDEVVNTLYLEMSRKPRGLDKILEDLPIDVATLKAENQSLKNRIEALEIILTQRKLNDELN